jgi:excisionase family DNA binding protein
MKAIEVDWLNLKEAAQFLDIPVRSLREKCRRNLLTHVRIDRTHWRFFRADLNAYLQRHTFQAKTVFGKN